MDWIQLQGSFDLPMETTKAQMLEMHKDFDAFVQDDEVDYLGCLGGQFNLCVMFDEEGEGLFEFLTLLDKWDMKLTHITVEDYEPKDGTVYNWCRAIQAEVHNGKDKVVELFKDFIAEQYPDEKWESTEVLEMI